MKEALGADFMRQRNAHFVRRALGAWKDAAQLELLGSLTVTTVCRYSLSACATAGVVLCTSNWSRAC
ncbi:hypothetical protein WJ970_25735 [Achromobacter xylosoxidans]